MSNEISRLKQLKEYLKKLNEPKKVGIKEYYDTPSKIGYDDIQVMIVTKDNTFIQRDKREGSNHGDIVVNMLGIDESTLKESFKEQEIANNYDYIIFEFISSMDPIAVITPNSIDFNDYQISELERIQKEIEEVNKTRDKKIQIEFDYMINDQNIQDSLDTLIKVAKENNNDIKKVA